MEKRTRLAPPLALLLAFAASACEHSPTETATAGLAPMSRPVLVGSSAASHHPPALGSRHALRAAEVHAQSGTQFTGFHRYPAEERWWLPMEGNVAYFRDAFTSGDTRLEATATGQNWHVTATGPDGTEVQWSTITFHEERNDQRDCFVAGGFGGWTICGSKVIYVQWYMPIQCMPTGQWTMRFFEQGATYHEGSYTLKPTIPPGKVPLWNQNDYPNVQYSNTCQGAGGTRHTCDGRAGESILSVARLGCALVSATMMLNYHGVMVDPVALNQWMRENNGYSGAAIIFPKVAQYARQVHDVNITFVEDVRARDDTALERRICQYGPQPISVFGSNNQPNGHFVAATGRDDERTTFIHNDPAGGVVRTLANFARYRNTHSGRRVFSGPQYTYTDPLSGMQFFLHSPAALLVTDSRGRRTGHDPVTNRSYSEIPGAFYDSTSIADPADASFGWHTTKEFSFMRAPAGEYTVTVTGTGSGVYTLDARTWSRQGHDGIAEFRDVATGPEVTHTYTLRHDPAGAGGPIPVHGGFSGGGQKGSVDAFLTYSAPTERSLSLPAGTTTYPLMLFYGPTIDPATFSATLNGTNVRSLFNPRPGGMDAVSIPLQGGRNVLLLEVRGSDGRRMPRDADRLVFVVR